MDERIIYTLFAIAIAVGISAILKGYLGYKLKKLVPKTAQGIPVRGIINTTFVVFFIFAILSIWGVSFANLWVALSGVIALVAIGFFAVWSILSNLLAGILLILRRKLKPGDEVVIMPEKIKGKIVETGVLFLRLQDKQYDVYVPNNMIFQKFVKIKRKK